MLLDAATPAGVPRETGLRWWRNERFTIGWKGHLFLAGELAGAASAAGLARLLEASSLHETAHRLRGVFGVFVHDRARGGWQVAVDNAGLYKIYHDELGAGTSFLELLRARRVGRARLDAAAIVEYLAHDAVLGPRTFVSGIDKLQAHEILELPADGSTPRLHAKRLPEAMPDDGHLVLERFADFTRSLEGRRLSADATGGFDSRLIICMLERQGLPLELAISGHPGTDDVEIARKIAQLLGRPFYLCEHDLGDLDAQLAAAFRTGDGMTNVQRFHRNRQNALARLGRGIEVFTHGGAGGLFRDHNVIQDFPFYGRRRVNWSRFYNLRMTPVSLPPDCLSPAGRELLAGVRPAAIARCEALRAPTNNESYDRVYFHLRSPEFYGHYFANYINMGLDVVAPFLDRDIALAAMRLSPWQRSFQLWHRRLITERCPALAALPTVGGFSASSEPWRMLGDVGAFGVGQLRRVANKISQRLLGQTRFHFGASLMADAPGFVGRLRASPLFGLALERLAGAGILAPGLAAATVRDIHVGRVLTTGMLLGEIEGLA